MQGVLPPSLSLSLSLSLCLPQVACGFEDCVETLLNAQADSSARSVTNASNSNISSLRMLHTKLLMIL